MRYSFLWAFLLVVLAGVRGFSTTAPTTARLASSSTCSYQTFVSAARRGRRRRKHDVDRLRLSEDDDNSVMTMMRNESDQAVVGVVGTLASSVVFASEYVLAATGCGLPAGPLGLFGLAEGLSYLAVVTLVGLSVVSKVKTGSGLPAGPAGLLGAAEGLSFLAVLAGVIVLGLQITNYGYIPNAVPMEGGMCS